MEELDRLKAELREKEDRIASLLAEKKAFIRVVSHDLRSPISRIIGFADLLEKDLEGDEDLQEFATMIVGAGWQLSNMITRIKEVEEFEGDEEERIIVEINIKQSLNSLVEDYRDLFEKKDITIQMKMPQADVLYTCDKRDFDLVVQNLLTNAAKFSPKGSVVRIELTADEQPKLKITDEGPGFHPEEIDMAFDKFSKLSAKPTGGETATGLGLYVVKTCVDRMGKSEIELNSAHGEGTSMVVTFA